MTVIAASQAVGIQFKNINLLQEALTHRSYLNEAKNNPISNERMEFLGDAILSFVVSNHLFTHFRDLPEGELTALRSAIVKTGTLAHVASKLGLGEHMRLSKGEEEGGGRQNTSLLADTFEAVIGAIYLDQGLEAAKEFISKELLPVLPEIINTKAYVDFKSEFQELVQGKLRVSPVYRVIGEEGPDHAKTFHVAVYVDGKEEGAGYGKSKQEAEQEAARIALEKWSLS